MTPVLASTNGEVATLDGLGADRDFRNTGRLAIDLALTGLEGEEFAHLERIPDAEELGVWFAWSQLAVAVPAVSEAEFAAARRLRAAIWQALQAALTDTQPFPEDVATIDAVAAHPPLVPQLAGEGWLEPTIDQALSTVARDAIELLSDPFLRSRLRTCASEDCGVPFVDVSRPGRRRWCEDGRCGDRNRQRAHRERVRARGN